MDAVDSEWQGEDDRKQLINGATAAEQDSLLTVEVLVDGGDMNGVKVEGTVGDQRASSPAASNGEHKKRKKKSSSRSRGSRHTGGHPLVEGIQKMVRRLSLESETTAMETLAKKYENVVLSADTESPVIYTDSVQRRSHSNDYFIVIVLMLLFLPFGGFIPLILLYMSNRAKRRGQFRQSIRYLRLAVKCSSAVFVFGTATVIVVIIVGIVTAVEIG